MSRALAYADPGDPLIAARTIPLLGRPELAAQAALRLQPVADRITGLLTDFLAHPDTEFEVRRRIPKILSAVSSERSADGLLVGLADARFAVRMNCARALVRIAGHTRLNPAASVKILGIVDGELSRGKVIWESRRRRQIDADSPAPEWFDDFLQDRANASLEYVFLLLSLLFDRKPLLAAFRSLHTSDRHLRGTALEYLQGILPAETCKRLWDLLGEHPSPAAPRELSQVINDLADASPTVFLRLKEQAEPPSGNLKP